jgi:hypothetical protein
MGPSSRGIPTLAPASSRLLSSQTQMGAHRQLQLRENPLTMQLQLNPHNFTNDNVNPPNDD